MGVDSLLLPVRSVGDGLISREKFDVWVARAGT